jgi:GAF domain-containing protein
LTGSSGEGLDGQGDRLQRLYAAVARRDGHPGPLPRLQAICRASMDLLSVTGVGVMLMAARTHQGTLHSTDDVVAGLEELQNAAAEGPCIDSYLLGRPVMEPDLAGRGRRTWPLLAAGALEAGMQALFSFPLQIDDTCFGALNLYRDRPGPLTDEEIGDARLLAAMATREVLELQAEQVPGSLPNLIADLSGDRTAIEQATGMVAAQLSATVFVAARRLRAVAAAQDRPLAEVARDVVERTLRLG